MNRYAYLNLQTSTVNTLGFSETPLSPKPYLVLLNEDEECGPFWTYSANSIPRFVAPPKPITWTAYQFLLRFTEAELTGIKQDAATDPVTWRFLTLATAAQEIINNDPTTIAGMDYLVSKNLITAQRKQEILG